MANLYKINYYANLHPLEKRVYQNQRASFFWFLWCIFWQVIALLIMLLLILNHWYYPPEGDIFVYFDGLNESEKETSIQILSEVQYPYNAYISQIIITKNFEENCLVLGICKSNEANITNGINYVKKILVRYQENETELRDTICHELLHDIVRKVGPEAHLAVYAMGESHVCYKNSSISSYLKREYIYAERFK